jgi:potassium voltage-gated channel Shaw-related subfamily C protein 1
LNIGGQRFETYRSTLGLIEESRLANLSVTNSNYDPLKKEYFFDRDPNSFMAVLNYYRTGKLHAPVNVCANLFYDELNFWGIYEREIQPCCWTSYSSHRDCDNILRKVIDEIESNDGN